MAIWGTGKPLREFLFVEDLADAILFLMENVEAKDIYEAGISHLNIGTGKDITIKDLSLMIKKAVGFNGKLKFDPTKPDGTPKKLLDVEKLNAMGFEPHISLREGIKSTYQWFLNNEVRK